MKPVNRFIDKNAESTQRSHFASLGGKDVIKARVSDHHPIVHDGVLFWNVMMKGNKRGNGFGFNNGFGIVETSEEYRARLIKIAQVIAELVVVDPSIDSIGLCEGPIEPMDVALLYQSLMSYSFMHRFRDKGRFHTSDAEGTNWGLLMLADAKYSVNKVSCSDFEGHPKLVNRFQSWMLEGGGEKKYLALAHLPFAGDELKTEQPSLSASATTYCTMITNFMHEYVNERLIMCADFNFNPYLIGAIQERALDRITHNNSIVLAGPVVETVTVDGILLSHKEKQKYFGLMDKPGLLSTLASEYRFFRSYVRDVVTELQQSKNDTRSHAG